MNGLSLTIKQGEIFALLGKNGAGKSTTISILTGLTAPTSGSVTIFGNDITTDMDVIRTIIGICPQEDVLWDELTVEEHLITYGKLKGMLACNIVINLLGLHDSDLPVQIKYYLESVGLYQDRDKLSKDLRSVVFISAELTLPAEE